MLLIIVDVDDKLLVAVQVYSLKYLPVIMIIDDVDEILFVAVQVYYLTIYTCNTDHR